MVTDEQIDTYTSYLTPGFQSHNHLCDITGITDDDDKMIILKFLKNRKVLEFTYDESEQEATNGDVEIVVRLRDRTHVLRREEPDAGED